MPTTMRLFSRLIMLESHELTDSEMNPFILLEL